MKVKIKFCVLAVLLSLTSSMPGFAHLGETYQSYKTRNAKALKFTGEIPSADPTSSNYTFVAILDPKRQKDSPGFAEGVTITVSDGKISGQSMAITTGQNAAGGTKMATDDAYKFVLEALGRSAPPKKEQVQEEMKNFSMSINSAYMGRPQIIRYPNTAGQAVLSMDKMGNLLIGVTPPAVQPTGIFHP